MMEKEISVFKTNAIPDNVRTIAGCVSAGDYDGDGDLIYLLVEGFPKNIHYHPEVFFCKIIRCFYRCNCKSLSCFTKSRHGHFGCMD